MDKLEISDSILEKATKCERGFKCLSGDNTCVCEVDDSSKLPLIKVKPKPDLSCPYCFSFNKSRYCRCPTRREIYMKYKM